MPAPSPQPVSPSDTTTPTASRNGSSLTLSSQQHDGPVATSNNVALPQPVQRRLSIKFAAESARDRKPPSVRSRIPSPPPPSAYNRGVSFDTFDNRDATDFSLTLNYKHKDYHSTRRSRTFLCAIDQNDYSDFALEWLIDELVDDGDEVVCLRVVERDSKIASESSVEEGVYRQEAEKLLESAIVKNSSDEKAISLVMELAVGKVQDIIQRMIQIYEPAVLIVGTRGRSLGGMQGLLPGSVSKYCLQQSPIPVIVVRPSQKREKKKKKRLADPTRKSYNRILRMSEARGTKLFDTMTDSANSSTSKLPEDEAAAVAKAIGLPTSANSRDLPTRPISKDSPSIREGSEIDDDDSARRTSTSSLQYNPVSPISETSSVAVRSPSLQAVNSPAPSDFEGEDSANHSPGEDTSPDASDPHTDGADAIISPGGTVTGSAHDDGPTGLLAESVSPKTLPPSVVDET